jgi:hypothetical protein
VIVVESRGESNATSLSWRGVVPCDHQLADGPVVTRRHLEDRIQVSGEKHSPDNRQQFN